LHTTNAVFAKQASSSLVEYTRSAYLYIYHGAKCIEDEMEKNDMLHTIVIKLFEVGNYLSKGCHISMGI
jgi:hypothetical protein